MDRPAIEQNLTDLALRLDEAGVQAVPVRAGQGSNQPRKPSELRLRASLRDPSRRKDSLMYELLMYE
jgi:hypothetical protein